VVPQPCVFKQAQPLNLLRLWRSGKQVAGVTLGKTWLNGPGSAGTRGASKAAALSRKSTGPVISTAELWGTALPPGTDRGRPAAAEARN